MVKKLTFYVLYFFNVSILAKEENYDSGNFKNIERNILTTKNNWNSLHIYNFQPSTMICNNLYFKKLKNPFFNFPIKTSTDIGLYEIKRFLSPLESNLAIDKNVLNNFKNFENKPSFLLSLTGFFLWLITLPYRDSIFNNQKFHF